MLVMGSTIFGATDPAADAAPHTLAHRRRACRREDELVAAIAHDRRAGALERAGWCSESATMRRCGSRRAPTAVSITTDCSSKACTLRASCDAALTMPAGARWQLTSAIWRRWVRGRCSPRSRWDSGRIVDAGRLLELYRGLDSDGARVRKLRSSAAICRARPVLTHRDHARRRSSRRERQDAQRRPSRRRACRDGPARRESRAGLRSARAPGAIAATLAAAALAAFRTPAAAVRRRALPRCKPNVRAMMDCSDGLSTDLDAAVRALADAARDRSRAGRRRRARAAPSARRGSRAFALAGGEDFELLVAVRPRAFAHLARTFHARFGQPAAAGRHAPGGRGSSW